MSSSSSADRDPLDRLAEEFVARYRAGQRPSLAEYEQRHPELAEAIRDLFPTLVEMEQLKPDSANATGAFVPASVVDRTAPEQIGEFRIVRQVGRGGMGVVYEAVQESLGRHVALKVLPSAALPEPSRLERFRREARAAARLHHSNIVPVFGTGEAEGLHYYAMQFIAGQALDAVLDELRRLRTPTSADRKPAEPSELVAALLTGRHAPAPVEGTSPHEPARGSETSSGTLAEGGPAYWRSVARLGAQAADALAYAHTQGVVHRDVKPSNLLLDLQGTLWVTDFGLAREVGGENLTQTGNVVGTLRYLAPERFDGAGDERSDLYALGLALYELLTLRPAFDANSRPKLVEQVLAANPPAPRSIDASIPRDLETVVLKAMAKEPGRRYPNAAALAEDLRRFLEDRPILARRSSSTELVWRWCRRNPVVAGLTGAVAALLLAVAGVSAWAAWEQGKLTTAAVGAKADAVMAKLDAQEATRISLRRQAQLYVDKGVRLLDDGDAPGAMVCFAEALRLDEDDPERAMAHRTRLAMVWRQCPRPDVAYRIAGARLVSAAAFSPDGQRLVTLHGTRMANVPESGLTEQMEDREAVLRDVLTGRSLARLPHAMPLEYAAFSRDGRYLVTLAKELGPSSRNRKDTDAELRSEVRVWDAATGEPRGGPFEFSRHYTYKPAFSTDGRRLLLVDPQQQASVLDVATGKMLVTGVDVKGNFVALSPEGRTVFAGNTVWRPLASVERTEPAQLNVWDVDAARQVRTITIHVPTGAMGGGSAEFLVSPDGSRLLLTGPIPCVYDAANGTAITGRLARGLERGNDGEETHVVWSPEGDRVLTVEDDGVLRVWDATTGALQVTGARSLDRRIETVQQSRDGRRLLMHGASGRLQVWDTGSGQTVAPPFSVVGATVAVAFSPDGRRVWTVRNRGQVFGWDLASAEPESQCPPGNPFPNRCFLIRQGQAVLSTDGPDTPVRLWDVRTNRPAEAQPRCPAIALAYSPELSREGSHLLTLKFGRPPEIAAQAQLWALDAESPLTGALPVSSMVEGPPGTRGAWLSSNGKRLATLHATGAQEVPRPMGREFVGEIRLWHTASGQVLGQPLPLKSRPNQVLFSPDARLLATTEDKRTRLWDGETGKALASLPASVQPHFVVFSPDGSRLAANEYGRVSVCETATGAIVARMYPQQQGISHVAFSPDGKRVVAALREGIAEVWDATSGERVALPLQHGQALHDVDFSPDGRLVLTMSINGAARLWDAGVGDPVALPLTFPVSENDRARPTVGGLFTFGGRIQTVTISPDGRLVALAPDGSVRLWNLTPDSRSAGELLRRAQGFAGRRLANNGSLVAMDGKSWEDFWSGREQWSVREDTASIGQELTWLQREVEDCLRLRKWSSALPQLDRLVTLAPEKVTFLSWRAGTRAELERWKEAAEDFDRAIDLMPARGDLRTHRAFALLAAGDRAGYRQACERLLARFPHPPSPQAANTIVAACTLGPDAVADYAPILAMGERMVGQLPGHPALLSSLGAAFYRAGRYKQAIRRLEQALATGPQAADPGTLSLLALAYHKDGRAEDARKVLDDLGKKPVEPASSWIGRMEHRLLLHEAEELIRGKPPGPMK